MGGQGELKANKNSIFFQTIFSTFILNFFNPRATPGPLVSCLNNKERHSCIYMYKYVTYRRLNGWTDWAEIDGRGVL